MEKYKAGYKEMGSAENGVSSYLREDLCDKVIFE